MKSLRKIIICLIIFIVILLISIMAINIKIKEQNKETGDLSETDIIIDKYDSEILNDFKSYLEVKNCIKEYTTLLNGLERKEEYMERYGYTEEDFNAEMQDNMKIVYSMLSSEFINCYNITEDNIIKHYNNYKFRDFIIDKIYRVGQRENVNCYFVYGRMTTNNSVEDYGFIVNLDTFNLTFSLSPYEYMQKEGWNNITESTNISIDINNKIEDNTYNKYKEELEIDDQTIAKEYFEIYKNNLIYDQEFLYNVLNKEYKEKRFNTYEMFKEYIENRYLQLAKANIEKYQKIEREGFFEYICIDQYNDYYVFQGTSPTNYSIMFDTYTVDLPEFLDRYNSTNEQGKVALNIQKIIQAINLKDYEYAYSCLSNGFKNNYFKTQGDFENYVKEEFYENNYVGYLDFSSEGNVYTYKIQISDNEEGQGSKKEKTIIMKLNEGTGFELSFNV